MGMTKSGLLAVERGFSQVLAKLRYRLDAEAYEKCADAMQATLESLKKEVTTKSPPDLSQKITPREYLTTRGLR